MALGDLWNRTLVYFGIAEEDDDWEDEDGYAAEESLEQSYRERPNVRRLTYYISSPWGQANSHSCTGRRSWTSFLPARR